MESSPPISTNVVHYQLTRQQIVGQWFRLRMFQRKKFFIYGLLFFCGIELLVVHGPRSYLGWVFIAFPFLFAFFFYRGLHNAVTQRPEMLGPRSMSFDRDGVVFASETTRVEYSWRRIRKLTENREYYLLHLDNLGSAATLPKVSFTPEQREQFLSYAKAIPA